jgi:hypothetical protein
MSTCRHQALIRSRLDTVWELVGDPGRHPEWWPRVMEVRGERFAEGDSYRQVTTMPIGRHETTMMIERLDNLREIRTRCLDTGMFADWRFTEAQDNTFVEVDMGIDPTRVRYRVFDMTTGRLYFRRWLEESVERLRSTAERSC